MSIQTPYLSHSNQLPMAVRFACAHPVHWDGTVGSDQDPQISRGFSGNLAKTQEGST